MLARTLTHALVGLEARRVEVEVDVRETAMPGLKIVGLADHASKYPQDGAGIISSLTATDGLAELADDVTEIRPGSTIGFLPYSVLAG